MLALVLGLLNFGWYRAKSRQTQRRRGRETPKNLYHYHGWYKAVLIVVLGLLLIYINNFKPSEEEEREFSS